MKLVLDWVKAAHIIKAQKISHVEAGLRDDPLAQGVIFTENKPVLREDESVKQAWVESAFATPILIIDGKEIECFKIIPYREDDEDFWPDEALAVLREGK